MQKTTERPVKSTQKKKTVKFPAYEIVTAVFCFLISRAGMFGIVPPLGISFLAVTHKRGRWGWLNLFSCVCGLMSTALGFVYLPSALAFAIISFFENKGVSRSRFATALYAGGSVLVTGLPQVMWLGGYMTDLLRLIICTFVAFFGVYVFGEAMSVISSASRKYLTAEEAVSLAVLFSLAALGLPLVQIGYISLRSVVCIFLVLFFSMSGKIGVSSSAGLVCGFLMGSETDALFAHIGTLGLCGLLGGMFGMFGKGGVCSAFMLGSFINACFAQTPEKVTLQIIDIAVAVLIFAVVPKRAAEFFGIKKPISSGTEESMRVRDALREKLGYISEAFSQLSTSISFFNKTYDRQKLDRFEIFDKAADEICRDCALSSLCWQKHYNDTYETMMRAFREIEKNGEVTEAFLPEFFKDRCEDCEGFIKSINRCYEQFKNELVWQDRLIKANELSAGRFTDAAGIVEKLCNDIDSNIAFNEELAEAAACALDKKGIRVNSVAVFKNPYGRYEVKVKCGSCGGRKKCEKMSSVISEILERSVEKTAGECMMKECSVTFSESSVYEIEHSVRGIPRRGEIVSGDNATAFTMPDGNVMLAISDGRGNGAGANLQSSETLRLLCKLMNAGFACDTALRLANTAMAVQTDDEQFATVDVAVLNTVTASGVFVKNGACSTYIKRGLKIIDITCDSLPVGVGCEFETAEKYAQLKEGDILIMISDGISDSFETEADLKEVIIGLNDRCTTGEITSQIINAAVSNCIREDDDMTVIAARITAKIK